MSSPLVVFDLDGTLIDSRQDLADSTNDVLESYGAAALPVDLVSSFVGEGARVLVERALAAAGLNAHEPDALERFRVSYDRRLLNHTRPYDGIREVVTSAADLARLAVLTNKPESPTRRLLDAFDLSKFFSAVIGGDARFARKPDPSGLRFLMHEAGASEKTALMVGDSMIDIHTARNARVRVLVAMYGFGKMRGELQLRGDELLAERPSDLSGFIAGALSAADH